MVDDQDIALAHNRSASTASMVHHNYIPWIVGLHSCTLVLRMHVLPLATKRTARVDKSAPRCSRVLHSCAPAHSPSASRSGIRSTFVLDDAARRRNCRAEFNASSGAGHISGWPAFAASGELSTEETLFRFGIVARSLPLGITASANEYGL